jgi:CheY-like chemotaxis protein/HPt (histidine-containing phosphotransfer) domain-containing protein
LILVAEDNLTNQNVIRRQLNLLGYATDMTSDGKQALEALESKRYAVLLTDCHMPEMDGFELARTIRNSERDSDRHLPIIAITASVLAAEIDRCFEAGMDDSLPKPLEMPKLKAALNKWMPVSPAKDVDAAPLAVAAAPQFAEGDTATVDPSALQSIFGDDPDTIREIMREFIEPSRNIVEEIESALAGRAAADIGAGAHKLKSAARSIGANELADLCQDLETAGKTEDWEAIDISAPRLPDIMQEVVKYIEAL